jgi:DUF4097 and DUF4098 domain-containing protein YvlB
MNTRTLQPLVIPSLIAALAIGATSADARHGGGNDRRVQSAGSCSDNSTSKLSAKNDDGRIETEFEVDQNRAGVRWKVRVRQNGDLVAKTHKTTRGRSGSFSLERRLANHRGKDRIRATATSPSGETCSAALTF